MTIQDRDSHLRPAPTAEEQALLSRLPPGREHDVPEPLNGFSSAEVLLMELDVNRIELSPSEQQRLKQIYDLMDLRQGENAVPFAIPRDCLQLPPYLLQCGIFAIEKPSARLGAELHCARKVPAGYRGTLTYSGPPMVQDHLWILIGILEHAMGKSISEAVPIYPRAFARAHAGWSDSKHTKKRLLSALCDLQQAAVTTKWADDNVPTPVRFIREIAPRIDGAVAIVLDPSILHLFRGRARTFISSKDRRNLAPGLTTWMLLFAMSSTCKPFPIFSRAGGFTVGWFKRICGANEATSVDDFEQQLLDSLEKLKTCGAIKDFSIVDGHVRIVKHGPSRRKAPGQPSLWVTKKGRRIAGDIGDDWEAFPEERTNF